jgi:CrcB protein
MNLRQEVLYVLLGGAAGAVGRHSLSGLASAERLAPFHLVLINAAGSGVLGALVPLSARIGAKGMLLLGTGLCGALTSFSSFSNDSVELLHVGAAGDSPFSSALKAAGFIISNNALSIAAAAGGAALTTSRPLLAARLGSLLSVKRLSAAGGGSWARRGGTAAVILGSSAAIFAPRRVHPESKTNSRRLLADAACVAAGGCLGASSRHLISRAALVGAPWSIAMINISGSYLMSIVAVLALPAHLQLFAMTGFCGGFTTVSTYASDVVRLLRQRSIKTAAAYILVNNMGSIAASIMGAHTGTLLRSIEP